MCADLRRGFELCRVRFVVHSSTPTLLVRGDRRLTRLIARNAILNALQQSVSDRTVTVETVAGSGIGCLRVTDEGSRLPRDMTERIFELEAQPALRQRGFRTGRGLGLVALGRAAAAQGATTAMSLRDPQGAVLNVTWREFSAPAQS